MNNAIDKRNFILMLSPQEGQELAKVMGFSSPSPDVVENEEADVLSKWGVFIAFDIYPEIVEAATWYTELLDKTGKLVSEQEETIQALSLFSMGLINKLVDSDKLIVTIPEDFDMAVYVETEDDDE
ncbi:MAG: hypothetical protein EBY92_05035 [Actinobacteria bacterium]|nr:hypothetical protein [Actinomycetota bacterium]